MATAISMITRAMRLSGAIGKGEVPDADESNDGLTALNSMLDSWQIQRLFVYQIRAETFLWTANNQSRTVGPAGNFVTDNPTRVADDCTVTVNGFDYPVRLIDVDAWANIIDKTTTSSWPWWVYVEYGAALATLYAYPIPSQDVTFNLRTYKRLQQFSSLTTALDLPPGNERAIVYSLAEEYAPEFGLQVPPAVVAIARSAKRALRQVNSPSPIMQTEAGYMTRRDAYSIYGDQA